MNPSQEKVFCFMATVQHGQVKEWGVDVYQVIASNDDYLVINTREFKTLRIDGKKDIMHSSLERVSVCDFTNISSLNYLSLTIFTKNPSAKIAENRMNKRLQDYCEAKCAPYLFGTRPEIRLDSALRRGQAHELVQM